MIDAPQEAYNWAKKIAYDHDCDIVALILTHGHWDHIIDAHKFSMAGIQIFGHRDDRQMFADPTIMINYALPNLELLPVKINRWMEHGEQLDILGVQMEIRHVPGHCPGNILVYVPSQQAAIVGDVIFSGSVPNLFQEEKGVVAEGILQDNNLFFADKILAKHDENYMPPELEKIVRENVK